MGLFTAYVVLDPPPLDTIERIQMLSLGTPAPFSKKYFNFPFLRETQHLRLDLDELTHIVEGNGTDLYKHPGLPKTVFKLQTWPGTTEVLKDGQMLAYLNHKDPEKTYVPKFGSLFSYNNPEYGKKFFGVAMEELGRNLQDMRWGLDDHRYLQLCQTLLFYHQHGILYGDVKPDNFGLDRSGRFVKGFDFDASLLLLPGEKPREISTVRPYRAPELLFGLRYGQEIDVFGLGCMIYELYVGEKLIEWNGPQSSEADDDRDNLAHLHVILERFQRFPKDPYIYTSSFWKYFEHDPIKNSFKLKELGPGVSIQRGYFVDILKRRFLEDGVPEHIGNDFIDLLTKMLELNPKKRISALGAVEHPFFDHFQTNEAAKKSQPEPARKKMKVKHEHPKAKK